MIIEEQQDNIQEHNLEDGKSKKKKKKEKKHNRDIEVREEKETKSPSTSEKARRESIREAKKASKAESETIAETDPTTAAREDVPPPRVVADTPLRPCLKRSYSVPRRLSISFNESVSSSDQTEEREMEGEVKD